VESKAAQAAKAAAQDPLEALIAQHSQRPAPAASGTTTAALPPKAMDAIKTGATRADATPASSIKDAEHTGSATDRLIIIALDPGHGGEDPGAIGPAGTKEKDVVLKLAHLLRERINNATVNGNAMRAYLTRDADFLCPGHTRAKSPPGAGRPVCEPACGRVFHPPTRRAPACLP